MVKLLCAGSLILLVAGCRGEPAGAKVSFVETRVDESQSPLPFVIALANSGGAATDATGVKLEIVDGFELPTAGAKEAAGELSAIDSAACHIEMLAGHPTMIPAHGEGVACGFVRWERPAGSPPAMGVVSASFLATLADGESIRTPPLTFVLASEAGWADKVGDLAALNREEANAALERIAALPGARTPGVDRLVEQLRELAK
jgi:hypothetical protein